MNITLALAIIAGLTCVIFIGYNTWNDDDDFKF